MFLLAALCVAAADGAALDAKPNFSGKWVLDAAKSNLGPVERVDLVQHAGKQIRQTISATVGQAQHNTVLVYTTDAKVNTNTVGPGRAMKSKATWAGSKLVIESKAELRGSAAESKETWELSADGKVLTVMREMKTLQSAASHKLIFNKQ